MQSLVNGIILTYVSGTATHVLLPRWVHVLPQWVHVLPQWVRLLAQWVCPARNPKPYDRHSASSGAVQMDCRREETLNPTTASPPRQRLCRWIVREGTRNPTSASPPRQGLCRYIVREETLNPNHSGSPHFRAGLVTQIPEVQSTSFSLFT